MVDINRREFLAAASAFTIVPRRVLGGRGYIAPSDMILLAQVGCGTQAQRQVNTGLVQRATTCSSSRSSIRTATPRTTWTGSTFGNRDADPAVPRASRRGATATPGIRAGRDVAQRDHGDLLQEAESPGAGIRSYEDYREMLEKETDIQGIVNITPDHQHGSINISALKKGKAAISHKPVAQRALRSAPHAAGQRATSRRRRTCSPTATRRIVTRSRRGSTRASSAPSAKCTTGPTVRSGRRGGRSTTRRVRRCPPASTGSCGRGPSPIVRTTRTTRSALYRGWYAYGAGCLGDMGFYSLWQPYRILESRRARVRRGAAEQRRRRQRAERQRRRPRLAGRPSARPAPSAGGIPATATARRSTRSGTTAA